MDYPPGYQFRYVRYFIRWPRLGIYLFQGSSAYELQIGNCRPGTFSSRFSFSIQWAYDKNMPWAEGKHLHLRRWNT